MKRKSAAKRGFFATRVLIALVLCFAGLALAMFALNPSPVKPVRDMPTLGDDPQNEPRDLNRLEQYWNDRVTYPTGQFNPEWVRQAADKDARIARGIPAGRKRTKAQLGPNPLALNPASFTALGPQPERMTGCSGCFDYTRTSGRVNAIVVDPTTTTNGSIVAYSASVGGGVWKTTNCCSSSTTWSPKTDDALISTTSIDTLAIDPNNHNTIYAGTGDLNFGSFSMGSQGILRSTDAGNSWQVLGADVFGPAYNEPAGQYPQYNAVGKVRVDPNNSNRVVAGTKKGLYFSYDAGVNWTGPCLTNSFSSQRQDITGLELSNVGGVTRIIAAVGTRGFPTAVQYDLGLNGANGIYKGTMPISGCPSDFTSVASNANGFVFGASTTGSPYNTGANMNAGSGVPCNYPITGGTATFCGGAAPTGGGANNLGRIDIAVAPSNPNVIYAQVCSIQWNSNSSGSGGGGCGNTTGCQLGAWYSTNGGTSWTFMAGSQGGALRQCSSSGSANNATNAGDYPQNWYNQGIAVDPNDPTKVWFDTHEVWYATQGGTTWYNTSCTYNQSAALGMHADEHALAFVPGSSSILLAGNDGGVDGAINANATVLNTTRPTWFNMDTGFNTIEFYNGDIWGGGASIGFATGSSPWAAGGAQDNMDSFVNFTSSPTGPVQWQGNIGGDGFFARIDGKGGFFYASNNSGQLHRCTTNCAGTGAVFGGELRNATMQGDRQSFVEPFDLFRGKPGGAGNAECGTRCNHIIVGSFRVWENVAADTTSTWTARTGDLTKNTLGNRSYINNLHYSPANQTLGIVATNDGNVQVLYGLGGTTTVVDLTGSNAVLPNRPILDVGFDSNSDNTVANPMIGYAAVGGFNLNTPATPGHVFRVVCNTVNCGSFTWTNKTGNLPDIPVDSIIANPNFPRQVFAGTDFGLYYTDDITANPPVWTRFNSGLPNVMIWSMSIDRGNTALSLWTRSRGAYAWPLPTGPQDPLPTSLSTTPATGTYGGTVNLSATLTSGGNPVNGKTISFKLNGNSVGSAPTDGSGVASLSNASLAGINAGTYPSGVGASFAGDAIYASSNATNSLTVDPASTMTSVASDNNPSTYGQSVTFTATVTSGAGTPTGSVDFKDGGTTIGSGALNGSGMATFATSSLSAGGHSITAVFVGSTNYSTSTSGVLTQTVNPASTSTGVSSDNNPSTYSQSVTFTATVTSGGGTPTGSVDFKDGGTTIGSGMLNGSGMATFATSSLSSGSHQISAVYAGDGNFSGSTSPDLTQVVQAQRLITVSVKTSVTGLTFSVDGITFTSSKSFSWLSGSSHTLSTTSPQSTGGKTYIYQNWSDGGAISHAIAPTAATTYTATFTKQ